MERLIIASLISILGYMCGWYLLDYIHYGRFRRRFYKQKYFDNHRQVHEDLNKIEQEILEHAKSNVLSEIAEWYEQKETSITKSDIPMIDKKIEKLSGLLKIINKKINRKKW